MTSDRATGLAFIGVQCFKFCGLRRRICRRRAGQANSIIFGTRLSSQTEARASRALAKSHKPHIRARIFSSLDATSSRLRTVAWLRAARSPMGRPRIRRRVSRGHCLESDQSKCACRIHPLASKCSILVRCHLWTQSPLGYTPPCPVSNVWLMLGAVGIFPRGRSVAAQNETFSVSVPIPNQELPK